MKAQHLLTALMGLAFLMVPLFADYQPEIPDESGNVTVPGTITSQGEQVVTTGSSEVCRRQQFSYATTAGPYVEVTNTGWTTFGRAIYPGSGEWSIAEIQTVASSDATGISSVRVVDAATGLALGGVEVTKSVPTLFRTQTISNLPAARAILEFQAQRIGADCQIGAVRLLGEVDGAAPTEQNWEAYWEFDEAVGSYNGTTGEVTDTRGNHDGTAAGSADVVSDGTRGNVLGLTGAGDYVNVGTWNLDEGSGLTVMAWVRPTSVGTDPRIIAKGPNTSTQQWVLAIDDGSPDEWNFRIRTGSTTTSIKRGGAGTVQTNTWQHVVGRWDGANMAIFKNGSQLGANQAKTGTLATSSDPIWIGDQPASGGRPFVGQIDEVRVYDRPLSDAEILAVYNEG